MSKNNLDKNGNIIYSVYRVTLGNNNRYIGMTSWIVEERVKRGLAGNYNDIVINTYNKHGLDKIDILYTTPIKTQAQALEISTIYIENTLRVGYGGLNHNGLNLDKGGYCRSPLKGELSPYTNFTYDDIEFIEDLIINTNLTFNEIGNFFRVHYRTISDINLQIHWGSTGKYQPPLRNINLTKSEFDNIEYDFENTNLTIDEISKKYNRSIKLIKDIKGGKHKLSTKDKSKYPIGNVNKPDIIQEDVEEMIFLYNLGIFDYIKDIAGLYEYNSYTLSNAINGERFKSIDLTKIQDKAEKFAIKNNIWY